MDRAPPSAGGVCASFDVPSSYGSYEELAADDAVDAVYVATPPSRHAADALLFLGAGKHVLCEKPFTLNATQTSEVVRAAHDELQQTLRPVHQVRRRRRATRFAWPSPATRREIPMTELNEPDLRLRADRAAPPRSVHGALTDPAALRVWLAEHAEVDLPGRSEFWGRFTPDGAEPHQRLLHADDRTLRFAWAVDGVATTVSSRSPRTRAARW